jgi:hypothetical protein
MTAYVLSSSMSSGDYRVPSFTILMCLVRRGAPWWKWCASSHCAVVDHHLACLSRLWLLHWHSAIGTSFCHVTLRSFYQSCGFCMNLKTTVSRQTDLPGDVAGAPMSSHELRMAALSELRNSLTNWSATVSYWKTKVRNLRHVDMLL